MSAREVELTGGAPWGFRMHGGVDQNQPLRISRVNPGRKASLCGVREGDVISSINGRVTRGMSNADAHAMLRGAGPVLRLGLNEDREMSPRRRSISKGSELKRPSQLLASKEEATLQEPIYATIKPPITQTWAPSSPLRSSLNSLPSLNSTPLVKSAAPVEQSLKFHPTNPFYTTLPSNYTSASKLPISNGKSSISTLDRNKTNKPNDCSPDLKSPLYFASNDFGSSSHLNSSHFTEKINGFGFDANCTANGKSDISYDSVNRDNPSLPNENEMKNPFRSNRINSDPFEKYLNPEHKFNGTFESDTKNMTNSMSDNSFHKSKEITERSTITEHKISEIEEVKTIKKIVLNGSGEENDRATKISYINGERKSFGLPESQASKEYYQGSTQQSTRNEHFPPTPTQNRNDNLKANNQDEQNSASSSTKYHFVQLNNDVAEVSDSSATESDDSSHSGREKTVNGESLTKKYIDPKRRTINKVSKKILKAIEKLTCNIKRNKKGKKVVEPTPVKHEFVYARRLIAELGRRLRERGCDPRSGSYLVQQISIAVQRGNAAGIMGTFEPGTMQGGGAY